MDCAVYEDGRRRPGRLRLEDAFEAARSDSASFAWIGLHEPTPREFESVEREFGLHPLAVEDAIKAHQRPKLEVFDDTLFVVLKTARYVDPKEIVDIGQVMVFLGESFVVTVRHGEAGALAGVRHDLEAERELLRCGPGAVLHAVLDRVVDEYADVLAGLDIDVDQIEEQVFQPNQGSQSNHAERIYRLKREVLEFRRAVGPLAPPLERLASAARPLPGVHEDLREYFRDVLDHVMRSNEHVDALDGLLSSVLDAQLAQIGVQQNDDMRKISAWVAIAAVPTMLAGIYGMNFVHMPELAWRYGYLYVLLLMGGSCLLLYRAFRKSGWL